MTTAPPQGVLAIWSDIAADVETDYRHWLTREHILERVGVDGFVSGRAFRCTDDSLRRYFIVYELQDSSALAGPSYMARLNAPSVWSQRIMPQLQNFARGGGRVVARAGLGQGGVVAPLRFDIGQTDLEKDGAAEALVERLAAFDSISAVWLERVDQQATTLQTKEKSMRQGGEGHFDALLCIEGLAGPAVSAAAASAIREELAKAFAGEAQLFSQCFALDRRMGRLPAVST
ncbi:MAG: hypothetical protein JWP77_915 [Polaromonas sp.]|jgi:hypothetical protein|nr:hypothetical protein [Polaromonas sp.]MDB5938551.1 hypothetical protein [Polaromonas sp.]